MPKFKLVVLCIFDPWAKMKDAVTVLDPGFDNSAQAELRALLWLTYRPNDIVMLEPVA